ncbi:MAG TPA: hypothetical protein EYH08_01875 [Pyrodictium sp.]|nr:hypothetical protein [Pyrodictium sp.]
MANVYHVLEFEWTLQFTIAVILAAAVLGAIIGRNLIATLSAVLAGYTVYATTLLLGLKPLSWIVFANLSSLMDRFTLLFAGAYAILTLINNRYTSWHLGTLVSGFYSLVLATLIQSHARLLPLLALTLLTINHTLYVYRRVSILVSLTALAMLVIAYQDNLQLLLVSTGAGLAIAVLAGQRTGKKATIFLLSSTVLLALYLLTLQPYHSSPLFWATILMLVWSLTEVLRGSLTNTLSFDEAAIVILVAALSEATIPAQPSNIVELIASIPPFTLATLTVLLQKHGSLKRAGFKAVVATLLFTAIVHIPATAAASLQPQTVLTKHCVKCHNGIAASTVEEMLANVRAWAYSYESLDEAVKKLYGYKSFRDYMAYMVKLTGLPSDYVEPLTDYFENIFLSAKKVLEVPKTVTISVDSLVQKLAPFILAISLATSSSIALICRRKPTSS